MTKILEVTRSIDKTLGTKRYRLDGVELLIRDYEDHPEYAFRLRGDSITANSPQDRDRLLKAVTELINFSNSHQALGELPPHGAILVGEDDDPNLVPTDRIQYKKDPVKKEKEKTFNNLLPLLSDRQRKEAKRLHKNYNLDTAIRYCNTVKSGLK